MSQSSRIIQAKHYLILTSITLLLFGPVLYFVGQCVLFGCGIISSDFIKFYFLASYLAGALYGLVSLIIFLASKKRLRIAIIVTLVFLLVSHFASLIVTIRTSPFTGIVGYQSLVGFLVNVAIMLSLLFCIKQYNEFLLKRRSTA